MADYLVRGVVVLEEPFEYFIEDVDSEEEAVEEGYAEAQRDFHGDVVHIEADLVEEAE